MSIRRLTAVLRTQSATDPPVARYGRQIPQVLCQRPLHGRAITIAKLIMQRPPNTAQGRGPDCPLKPFETVEWRRSPEPTGAVIRLIGRIDTTVRNGELAVGLEHLGVAHRRYCRRGG